MSTERDKHVQTLLEMRFSAVASVPAVAEALDAALEALGESTKVAEHIAEYRRCYAAADAALRGALTPSNLTLVIMQQRRAVRADDASAAVKQERERCAKILDDAYPPARNERSDLARDEYIAAWGKACRLIQEWK